MIIGDKITVLPIIENTQLHIKNNFFLNIVYEDDYLMVLNKQCGIIMHPGIKNNHDTILHLLLEKYAYLNYIPRAGIVHRLDKNTTGLVIIAKTLESYFWFNTIMKNKKITREYETIVYGLLFTDKTIENNVAKHPKKRIKMSVQKIGKKAITYYKILARYKYFSHLRVKLETGRTHQIRVHMEYIGHPVLGDTLYSKHNKINKIIFLKHNKVKLLINNIDRQLLHSKKISFVHPITQKKMDIEIPLPKDMRDCIKQLKKIN
ncbi:RluA family pseudouridine synthase [Buchnera aphidicola]|uniref:RluA family pseudouridine synthase n=1 Tax=Buchnera aphidicola TaxID=9 RepID=UPI003464DB21